jgi:hypothetical protein
MSIFSNMNGGTNASHVYEAELMHLPIYHASASPTSSLGRGLWFCRDRFYGKSEVVPVTAPQPAIQLVNFPSLC